MNEVIELTWRNFPGIVQKGFYASEEGVDYMDCPYPPDSPQKRAWVRGFISSQRLLRQEAANANTNQRL